ncbi:trafficking protein particle complex subunit 11-like protein [Corchorus olitorius]|uniref:Trafficking protein particle complex subunit 11-like protein n=1 Tax=Corchorus olitorius TaxID=93759 RepID=A0A1R3GPU5_9ROSI|nr:trafficking protein particle complex subunit 11-like protein [Corchorus olitorius]
MENYLVLSFEESVIKQDNESGNVGADHAVFEQGAFAENVGNENLVE